MTNIISPVDTEQLEPLTHFLREQSGTLKVKNSWPANQLQQCADCGVFRWFSATDWGGLASTAAEIYEGYMKLSAACLTTTFIVTQRQGASRRIENSGNRWLAEQLIPPLNSGQIFATVGLSHLTTSHRHLKDPAMKAEKKPGGFVLEGFSPWVTGAKFADWIVIGASMDDDNQILVAVDTNSEGVSIGPATELVALTTSQTGPVFCDSVFVPDKCVLAGPVENVMQSEIGGDAGSLQTSALALGLSSAAIEFIKLESASRHDLESIAEALERQWNRTKTELLDLASGIISPRLSREKIRSDANSLALRSTQAALSTAKGAGYVEGHPVGRWCREALFFLVWSCPQTVAQANLCEFAGIES